MISHRLRAQDGADLLDRSAGRLGAFGLLCRLVGIGRQSQLIRLSFRGSDFGERQLRQTLGIVFSQAKPIDDEKRDLAAHLIGARRLSSPNDNDSRPQG
jgi:hypothetical protein